MRCLPLQKFACNISLTDIIVAIHQHHHHHHHQPDQKSLLYYDLLHSTKGLHICSTCSCTPDSALLRISKKKRISWGRCARRSRASHCVLLLGKIIGGSCYCNLCIKDYTRRIHDWKELLGEFSRGDQICDLFWQAVLEAWRFKELSFCWARSWHWFWKDLERL